MRKCSVALTNTNWIHHTSNVKVFEKANYRLYSFWTKTFSHKIIYNKLTIYYLFFLLRSDIGRLWFWAMSWQNLLLLYANNKGADQPDQHLCCSLPRQYNTSSFYIWNFKPLASFCCCEGLSAPLLFSYGINRFSHDAVHLYISFAGYIYLLYSVLIIFIYLFFQTLSFHQNINRKCNRILQWRQWDHLML